MDVAKTVKSSFWVPEPEAWLQVNEIEPGLLGALEKRLDLIETEYAQSLKPLPTEGTRAFEDRINTVWGHLKGFQPSADTLERSNALRQRLTGLEADLGVPKTGFRHFELRCLVFEAMLLRGSENLNLC